MVKFNEKSTGRMRVNQVRLLFLVSNALFLILMAQLDLAAARDRGEDIIMTKGKLIMRGGKGKGNLILDTGSSKGSEHVMPMMPMHFNPYAFYPMQHHQPPMMKIQPIFVEDHSAMHHQPEQHHEYQSHGEPQHHQHYEQHQEQHHEVHHEPKHQEEHHEMHHEPKHHEMHYEPEHHHEMMHHHEPEHYHQPEMHHYEPHQHHEMYHHEPEQHHEEQHHESMMGHYGGGHEEEKGHHMGYETHPMITMMMHGSGLQPSYQQFAAMHGYQPPGVVYGPQQHSSLDTESAGQSGGETQQDSPNSEVKSAASNNGSGQQQQPEQQAKVVPGLLKSSSNNPLMAIIKPLLGFKRNQQQGSTEQNKKPQS